MKAKGFTLIELIIVICIIGILAAVAGTVIGTNGKSLVCDGNVIATGSIQLKEGYYLINGKDIYHPDRGARCSTEEAVDKPELTNKPQPI